MIALANIMLAIGNILNSLLSLMVILIVGRVIVSWVNADPFNPIVRFIIAATDPILKPLRRFVPPIGGTLDLTPIVAWLLLYFLQLALAQTIIDYAHDLKRSANVVSFNLLISS